MDLSAADLSKIAGINVAVLAILNALAAKFLVPRYFKDQDDFRDHTEKELLALEERRTALREHVDTEFHMLRESWHSNNNSINVTMGRLLLSTERNAIDINKIVEEGKKLQGDIHSIDKSVESMKGELRGLTVAVNALNTYLNGKPRANGT